MNCECCYYELGRRKKLDAYEICPCCGFEKEVDDPDWWYRGWIDSGCRWFSTATPAPDGWNPFRQAIEKCRDTICDLNNDERHDRYILIEKNISEERIKNGDDCGVCFVLDYTDKKLTSWIESEDGDEHGRTA